jgi:CVNH domain
VLTANCQTMSGNWNRSSLSPNQCGSYRAANRDGNLFCESGNSGSSVSRWDGSFDRSCRDASVNSNGVLTANCQTMSGNWNRSSLSPGQCSSTRAGNRDGTLFCE